MKIEYQKIIDKDRDIISDELKSRLTGRKNWMYAAVDTDEDTWCAYLVLALSDCADRMMQLHELYVKPEYRGYGIARRLVEYALGDAGNAGVTSVYYKEIGSFETDIWINASFCQNCGFNMAVANERIDYYEAKRLLGNKKIQQLLKRYGKMKIAKIEDRQDARLRKLEKRINVRMSFLSDRNLDLRYSRFYIEQGDIRAAIYVDNVRPYRAVITGIYVDKDFIEENINLVRLMLMVHAIDGVLSDGCEKVYIMTDDEWEQGAAAEIMGEPDGICYATEWVKEL